MNIHRLAVVALLTACTGADPEPDPGDAEAFCTELAESNDGCWTDDLDQDCLDRYAECGEGIAVMESCPVQLGC